MTEIGDEMESFRYIINLVYDRCRVRLHDGKQALIRARLGKRMRLHGFATLADYCHFLKHQAEEDEITQVIDALTTNFTNFLREPDHLKFMVEQLGAKPGATGARQFQIWSAACATGEEPYSIAFYLSEAFPPPPAGIGGFSLPMSPPRRLTRPKREFTRRNGWPSCRGSGCNGISSGG